jgi:hypothetical protein
MADEAGDLVLACFGEIWHRDGDNKQRRGEEYESARHYLTSSQFLDFGLSTSSV